MVIDPFTRAFHSEARVRFVKSLPCLACRTTTAGRDNHHIRTGGMGLRESYQRIVPLCADCHEYVHRQGADGLAKRFRMDRINAFDWAQEAMRVELLWQLHRQVDFAMLTRKPVPSVISSFLDGHDVAVERHGNHVMVHVAAHRPETDAWPEFPTSQDTVDWLDGYRVYQNAIKSAPLKEIDHPLAGTVSVFAYAPAAADFVTRLGTDLRLPSTTCLTTESA